MFAEKVEIPPLYYTDDDGILHLNFHFGQTLGWNSRKRFIFIIAGSQGGKTSWGPIWLAREIEERGRGDYLAVTSNFDLFKLKLLPSILEFFEGTLKNGRFWAGERIVEIADPATGIFWARKSSDPMYARIILRSAVARGGLESASVKGAWLDECGQDEFTLGTWQAVRRRLSLARGRVLGTTTPYNLGWLKTEIIDRWKAGDPDIDVIRFASVANPLFPKEEFLDVMAKMARWKFLMMYMGFFTRPAGMIYEDFVNKNVALGGHLVDDFEPPSNWPIHVGIDPGSENITKVWMAENPNTGLFIPYREEHGGKKSTKEHVADMLEDAFIRDQPIDSWHIGAKGESQQRMDFKADGETWLENNRIMWKSKYPSYSMYVPDPKITDVEAGIDRVIEGLRLKRLLFSKRGVPGVIKDILNYARELDDLDLPTEKIKDKEKFHYADALRYDVSGSMFDMMPVTLMQGKVAGRGR